MQTPPLPDAEKPDDHLLEDLASLTGLFNPEVIWQEEQQLEELEQQEKSQDQVSERD